MQDEALFVQWFNRISPGKPVRWKCLIVRLVEPAVSAASYRDSGMGFEQWLAVVV
jgi:hypothetical protein